MSDSFKITVLHIKKRITFNQNKYYFTLTP